MNQLDLNNVNWAVKLQIKKILVFAGSRQVTAATAFLLALFSHILNHVVIRLQGALYEKENPNKLLQSGSHPYGKYTYVRGRIKKFSVRYT